MIITNIKINNLKRLAHQNPQLAFFELISKVQDFRLCNFNRYHIINKDDAIKDLEVVLSQYMGYVIKNRNDFSPDDDTKYNNHLCNNNSKYLYFTGLLKRLYMIKHNNTKYFVEPFTEYTNNQLVILPLTTSYVMQSINKYCQILSAK